MKFKTFLPVIKIQYSDCVISVMQKIFIFFFKIFEPIRKKTKTTNDSNTKQYNNGYKKFRLEDTDKFIYK